MTVVKICGITELEHGLCALEAGADLLGFVFAPSRRQLSLEAAARMVERCRRLYPPKQRLWQAAGVFANQPIDFVLAAAEHCRLDIVQLSGREPADYCRRVPLPVYKAIHISEMNRGLLMIGDTPNPARRCALDPPFVDTQDCCALDPPLFRCALDPPEGVARLLLDSGGAGRWGGTGETFPWEWIGRAARDCLVAGGLNPGNVADAIAAMRPWGVDVSSGVESNGRKDPELIRRFIDEVRRSSAHAAH